MGPLVARGFGILCPALPTAPQRRSVRVQASTDREQERSCVLDLLLLGGVASVVAPATVLAADVDDSVDSTVGAVKGAVDVAGDYAKTALGILDSGIKTAKEGYEVAAPVLKDTYEKVAPVVSSGVDALTEAAGPALDAATPTVEEGAKRAEEVLAGQGVNVEVIKSGAGSAAKVTGEVITAATPAAKNIFTFLTTTDPVVLGEYGLILLGSYFFGPAILGVLFGAFKGYAGKVSAPQVLDALRQGDTFLVDIRSQEDKERSGVPDLPANGGKRYIELPFAETSSRRLRNQLRNPQAMECQITAVQIASLKKLNPGRAVYLLDRNGSVAPDVAKELNSRGFKKCFVVQGGYNGWTQSKLQVKPSSSVSNAEVIAPVVGTIFGTGSTRRPAVVPTTVVERRRALPPGK